MMITDFEDTNIEFLKGVGAQKAALLRTAIGVSTFGDLLNYFPFRYVDKGNYVRIRDIHNESVYYLIKGKAVSKTMLGERFKSRLVVRLEDESGGIDLVWFKGQKWIEQKITIGQEYVVFGKPTLFKNIYNIAHPELELYDSATPLSKETLYPLYNTTEIMKKRGLNSKAISKLLQTLLDSLTDPLLEILPKYIRDQYPMLSRTEAYRAIHFPRNEQELAKAQKRLKFDELYILQIRILKDKRTHTDAKSYVFSKIGQLFNQFYHDNLPFQLTSAQQRVLKEIRADLRTGLQMNRLLQGDVGSGKTLVALMSMLIAADNGFQSCFMAPTEILANQHYQSITQFLLGMDIQVALLTGSTKTKERNRIYEQLSNGEIQMIIGTHALIEDKVIFKCLGLCIIDEQHRFGVAHRARLWNKSELAPHILVMTATPIPRTLAMTLYGDLDISVIDELPPNRKPVQTLHRYESSRYQMFQFLKQEIQKGRQIYVVYPLIAESEKSDLKNLEEGYHIVCYEFPMPDYHVSIMHGKLPQVEKDLGMKMFKENKTQIMLSTTVIEVGVDVPNASVMVIENAERFGLSQLHQLRGRVGRGADQSYCILMSKDHLSNDARLRLDTMVKTNDGFQIAEVDLQLRGPGDIQGTEQSGSLNLKIANLTTDEPIVKAARQAASVTLDKDPLLNLPEHQIIIHTIAKRFGATVWSKIS
ncbi:ATP-dependent DNA helicase RecG [Bacteroidia bacterium]|nr:ATP-dependent DNA helicase RecG [Bacteroidia bacterium]